jgi:hypothetical protein
MTPGSLTSFITKRARSASQFRRPEVGTKPPNAAFVKSTGRERLWKRQSKNCQVRIEEMNASEPLMRCRNVYDVVKIWFLALARDKLRR